MKEKRPELPLQHIHSIRLWVQPDRWASPVSLCHPCKADGPALDGWTCFPHEQTLGGGGLLILCSFLRLIIHSTGSSCYRCPALHPRSSHWGLTLKKKQKKKHSWWSSAPEGRRKHFGLFTHCSRGHSLLIQRDVMLKIVMSKYKQANVAANEKAGPAVIKICGSKWGFWPAINEKRAPWLSHSSWRELFFFFFSQIKYIHIML